jgi:hypothetical protein
LPDNHGVTLNSKRRRQYPSTLSFQAISFDIFPANPAHEGRVIQHPGDDIAGGLGSPHLGGDWDAVAIYEHVVDGMSVLGEYFPAERKHWFARVDERRLRVGPGLDTILEMFCRQRCRPEKIRYSGENITAKAIANVSKKTHRSGLT